jgi:hypothetical protein
MRVDHCVHQYSLSFESARTTERLTEICHRAVSLQTYPEAHDSRRQAELALAATELIQLENYATLCQAFGGGTCLEGICRRSRMSNVNALPGRSS